MQIRRDGNGSLYIEWEQVSGSFKRAWVQHKHGTERDWAGTGRYLNVVRCNSEGHPGGNPTDFPIHNDLSDEQILRAFVHSVSAIVGAPLAKETDDA